MPAFQLVDALHDPLGAFAEAAGTATLLGEKGITTRLISPWKIPRGGAPILVGGGEVVNAPGDPYCDAYRLKGPNILNAAGSTTQLGLDYLRDYKYVSVRSTSDALSLEGVLGKGRVQVVPPTSIALDVQKLGGQAESSHLDSKDGARPVVVSITKDVVTQIPGISRILSTLSHSRILLCPLDPAFERILLHMRIGAEMTTQPELVLCKSLEEAARVLSGASLVVSACYLGVVWAYRCGVPCLGWGKDPSIFAFLKDRGLDKWAFFQASDLLDKLATAQSEFEDTTSLIKEDLKKLSSHADKLAEIGASAWSRAYGDAESKRGSSKSREFFARTLPKMTQGEFSEPNFLLSFMEEGGVLEGIPKEILWTSLRAASAAALDEAYKLAERTAFYAEGARFWKQVAERHKKRADEALGAQHN